MMPVQPRFPQLYHPTIMKDHSAVTEPNTSKPMTLQTSGDSKPSDVVETRAGSEPRAEVSVAIIHSSPDSTTGSTESAAPNRDEEQQDAVGLTNSRDNTPQDVTQETNRDEESPETITVIPTRDLLIPIGSEDPPLGFRPRGRLNKPVVAKPTPKPKPKP
ncbi:hypothetical protein BKA93DRAFT_175255 [Sparassis latifolia]